ncbi:NACHT domain-containing protein [Streptomyces zingiberis]|uniref:NACHT domain-containing protein n=1 Tax=Streptomyces zingiberis TaxID=2053010 RepID=A0ABX1BYB8_9ACTN|nr:NACHT domain-containing protein [Streptomyces zingiberis]NJQ01293.1 NACHT domain-containing protein [Streptomyces zingiberis]
MGKRGEAFAYGAVAALMTVTAVAIGVWTLLRADVGEVDPTGAMAGLVSLASSGVLVWLSRRSAADAREIASAEAARELAAKVLGAERDARVQLLGGDDKTIDVSFTFLPVDARNARRAGAEGHLRDVVEYYRRLRPRRMVITGEAGAGKTVLAVELMVRLLEKPAEGDPVPVRLSLASWDTRNQTVDQWISRHLTDTYNVPARSARRLVESRTILPVLDGLDEMDDSPGYRSPAGEALRALNRYQLGTSKAALLLTCRSKPYETLAEQEVWLQDAAHVKIEPVPADAARRFLTERFGATPRWRPVLEALTRDPHGPLAAGLSTPWRLTLAVTVYEERGPDGRHRRDPRALLAPELDTPKAVGDHLLSRFLPGAATPDPTPSAPPGDTYPAAQVRAWLTALARHLQRDESAGRRAEERRPPGPGHARGSAHGVDIVLHRLWPIAGATRVRCLHAVFLLCGALAFADFAVGTLDATVLIYAGIVLAVLLRTGVRREVRPKKFQIGKLATRSGAKEAAFGLLLGLPVAAGVGTLFALASLLATGESGVELLYTAAQGFTLGLLLAPALGLALGTGRRLPDALAPRDPLRTDLQFGLALGLVYWIGYGVAFWPVYTFMDSLARGFGFTDFAHQPGVGGVAEQYAVYGWTHGFAGGAPAHFLYLHGGDGFLSITISVVLGFAEAIVFGLAFGSTAWTRYAIAVALAARRGKLPRRPGPFLDWAHRAGLLRLSGIAYQFRHLELQHWLAHHGDHEPPGRRAGTGPTTASEADRPFRCT